MTPNEQRNERLGAKMVKAMQRRHFDAYYCATASEAKAKVNELIPEGASVTWGGTMTVRDMDIPKMLQERGTLKVWDRDKVETPKEKQEMYLRAFQADYYLSSANAITEDGIIVNIDGNGNRVAAITWGPQHVIFVVGMNKVAQDPEAALKRARSTAAPINAARFDIQTPCQLDGQCHNCNSPQSICNYIQFLRNSSKPGRIIVILVGENLGY